jgi:copper homeostasis protein
MSRPLLEVCVDSLAGVCAASEAGADRIELCAALDVGGLTPSLGLIREARAATSLPIFVMLRPRPGDFCFDDTEFRVLCADLDALHAEDVQGVVTGVLSEDLSVDVPRTRELVELAGNLPVTFHRAFDLCTDATRALNDLIACGIARILTSGGATRALDGAAVIRDCVAQAGAALEVVAGGGVDAESLEELLSISGARAVHTSASRSMPPASGPSVDQHSSGRHGVGPFSLAPTLDAIPGGVRCTDPDKIAACRHVLEQTGDRAS